MKRRARRECPYCPAAKKRPCVDGATMCAAHLRAHRELMKRQYHARRRAGLCVKCERPTAFKRSAPGKPAKRYSRCDVCRADLAVVKAKR